MAPDLWRWFDKHPDMWPATQGNAVDFFITGEDAFLDIGRHLETDAARGSAFYLLGWSCDLGTRLTPKSVAGNTLKSHLTWFAKRGGNVFAMVWKNTLFKTKESQAAVAHINSLPAGRGRAILDSWTPLAGTHHQKVQIVVPHVETSKQKSASGIGVAYCGGMDFDPNRIGKDALHDVHCRVRGAATQHFLDVFNERWADHPGGTSKLPVTFAGTKPAGKAVVQICRTYPAFQSPGVFSVFAATWLDQLNASLAENGAPTAGDMRDGGSVRLPTFYPATAGVQQVWRAVRKAIAEAQQFIYLEDQYFTNQWVGDALASKLLEATDLRIVLVLLSPSGMDVEQAWQRRRKALSALVRIDPHRKRWTVVQRRPGRPFDYVHSKTWVFDDELVITGSANADRRGYTYNSEVDVVVAGEYEHHSSMPPSIGATTIAQDLRCRLFARHLGGKPADHLDASKALTKFMGALNGADVEVFNPNATIGGPDRQLAKIRAKPGGRMLDFVPGGPEEFLWNYVHDPDPDVKPPPP